MTEGGMDRIKDDFHPIVLFGSQCSNKTTEMPNLRSSYSHCRNGSAYTGQSQFPAELIVIWDSIWEYLGHNLWTGSLHHLRVHDPLENPETINRPSLEFPKQRPSQDTNTIFSVHVVSLREVSTRSMSETGFGAIFFPFPPDFSPSQVRSDSFFSVTKFNHSEQNLPQLAVYY